MGATESRWTNRVWAICIAIGLAVTLSVTFLPPLRFSYRNPALHIVLDTVEAMIAFLVAYVMYGRFRTSRQARDLALVLGLTLLGVSSLFFSVVLEVTIGEAGEVFAIWTPVGTRLMGTVAFAVAAFLPARISVSRPHAFAVSAAFAFVVLAFVLATLATAASLPSPIDASIDPGASQQVLIVGHPTLLAAQVATMILFAAAAGAFLTMSKDRSDPVYGWFGAGSILAAFARVNYFLFPSLYSEFVYVGDAFRLAFYGMLLVGAIHEIRSYWQTRAEAEVLEVRNQLAQNLHDGLAQELVFIAAQTRRLARHGATPGELDLLHSASDRAVAEARRAIAALSRPIDESLADALAEAAEEEARRRGVPLRLALQDGVDVSPDRREGLVRITREAVKNAAQHADANLITVTLDASDGLCLTIRDDGVGFRRTTLTMRRDSVGIVMMRERAEAMGGRLALSELENGGTEVRITLPWTG